VTETIQPGRKRRATATARETAATLPAQRIDEDAASDLMGQMRGLSIREARFVEAYIACFNGGQAYKEAGYQFKNDETARACGSRVLSKANVRAHMAARIKDMIARSEEHQDALMAQLRLQAFADVRELVEYHRGACRYCHGKFCRYQYTAGEWDGIMTRHAERQEKALEAERAMPPDPDPKGGTGYNLNADPNPDCGECGGYGIGRVIVKDTRHLSPAALAVYAGVKEGKDGIEVKIKDQNRALETLAKIAKLYEDSTQISLTFNAAELTAKFEATMQASAARMAKMRADRLAMRREREQAGDGS
jgi:hypothetical protein